MAMRLRKVHGIWIAMCAAKTIKKSDDVYIDDTQDHAIRAKISYDNRLEGLNVPVLDKKLDEIMKLEENRAPEILSEDSHENKLKTNLEQIQKKSSIRKRHLRDLNKKIESYIALADAAISDAARYKMEANNWKERYLDELSKNIDKEKDGNEN